MKSVGHLLKYIGLGGFTIALFNFIFYFIHGENELTTIVTVWMNVVFYLAGDFLLWLKNQQP